MKETIIYTIISTVIIYLLGSFISMEPDFTKWDVESRFLYIYFSILGALFLGAMYHER